MNKEELINKWLSGTLTQEESSAFESLEDAAFLKGIVDNASAFKASHFSSPGDYSQLKDRLGKKDESKGKIRWIGPLLRVASVVLIGFVLSYFLWPGSVTKIDTRIGEQTTITLPDESRVTINAVSELAFNERKWDKNRQVRLIGEAFFDVVKGSKFKVITPEGEITVLGTEFNVKQRGDFFEVSCYEGKVQVVSGNYKVILEVGDKFRSSGGKFTTGKNSFSAPQWTQNTSTFERVAISEVFTELERQFGISVTFENVDSTLLFTGGFTHGDLENALKSITEPLNLHYSITETNNVRVMPGEK
ncbi:FecR family protein [Lentiprolixibacter aurantiacus]|uniref:FecR domain-containing protein n=1 Tax=Lentiprolixibacter aurantiacus TaxID=2993939 RepID=A0AAE3MN07_9FLAO|nr:FecR domain-containing protein [Lentiprolixibacter aurantiacus]MCX2720336.1 FecR domain-containing protein [Lentiprolixibacter aurantiacus]